jgi:hypothetical protein
VLGRLERHILCVLLQLAAVYAPWLRDVLRTVPLTAPDWGVIAVAALTPVAVVDVVKLAQRWRSGGAAVAHGARGRRRRVHDLCLGVRPLTYTRVAHA